jgi:hypothetical protein
MSPQATVAHSNFNGDPNVLAPRRKMSRDKNLGIPIQAPATHTVSKRPKTDKTPTGRQQESSLGRARSGT